MKHLKKWQFYLLSFTWGLPLSLAGVLVCGVLVLCGYHVKRYGLLYYIAIGESWGGLELGWFFLVSVPERKRYGSTSWGTAIRTPAYSDFLCRCFASSRRCGTG